MPAIRLPNARRVLVLRFGDDGGLPSGPPFGDGIPSFGDDGHNQGFDGESDAFGHVDQSGEQDDDDHEPSPLGSGFGDSIPGSPVESSRPSGFGFPSSSPGANEFVGGGGSDGNHNSGNNGDDDDDQSASSDPPINADDHGSPTTSKGVNAFASSPQQAPATPTLQSTTSLAFDFPGTSTIPSSAMPSIPPAFLHPSNSSSPDAPSLSTPSMTSPGLSVLAAVVGVLFSLILSALLIFLVRWFRHFQMRRLARDGEELSIPEKPRRYLIPFWRKDRVSENPRLPEQDHGPRSSIVWDFGELPATPSPAHSRSRAWSRSWASWRSPRLSGVPEAFESHVSSEKPDAGS